MAGLDYRKVSKLVAIQALFKSENISKKTENLLYYYDSRSSYSTDSEIITN